MTVAPTPKMDTPPPGMYVSVTSLEPAPWPTKEEAVALEESLTPEQKRREKAVRNEVRAHRRDRLETMILEDTRLVETRSKLAVFADDNEWLLFSLIPLGAAALLFMSILPFLGAAIVLLAVYGDRHEAK